MLRLLLSLILHLNILLLLNRLLYRLFLLRLLFCLFRFFSLHLLLRLFIHNFRSRLFLLLQYLIRLLKLLDQNFDLMPLIVNVGFGTSLDISEILSSRLCLFDIVRKFSRYLVSLFMNFNRSNDRRTLFLVIFYFSCLNRFDFLWLYCCNFDALNFLLLISLRQFG